MFEGQVTEGGCVSLIVTVNVHDAVLVEASVAVHITVDVPFRNVEPDGGLQTTVTPAQLSVAVAVYVTFAREH